jgi:hypothetical protein
MIANWAPQLGWFPSSPTNNSPSGPERVAEQPSTLSAPVAPQATSVTQTVPHNPAAAAPADPSPDLQQLEAMARHLVSLQQSVEKLAAGQERMARDIARLQAAEKDIRHRISVPPPQSAVTPARKPVPVTPPPKEAAPQVSAAPPPPAPSPPSPTH